MADLLELHQRNAVWFDDLVREVGDRWHAPTPCTEWDVRDLVNHLTAEQLWVPHLLAGETIEEVGDRYEGDVLGDDPVGRWDAAIAAAREAWAEPGALDRTVQLSFGEQPASLYLSQMVGDLAIHSWDLATALGAPRRIDPETVEAMLPEMESQSDVLAASGLFDPPVDVGDGADAQARLLALTGRRS